MTRGEAIKTLRELWRETNDSWYEEVYNMAIEALSTKVVQGEWISNHDGSWNCSECGLRVFVYAKGNFCPNCGADMRHKGSDGE